VKEFYRDTYYYIKTPGKKAERATGDVKEAWRAHPVPARKKRPKAQGHCAAKKIARSSSPLS
jgi:hypothetical protein